MPVIGPITSAILVLTFPNPNILFVGVIIPIIPTLEILSNLLCVLDRCCMVILSLVMIVGSRMIVVIRVIAILSVIIGLRLPDAMVGDIMPSNFVKVRYTETYDLNTIKDQMSVLAFHTPQAGALKAMFKGFFEQYRKYRILGCDIRMVAASQLPLDALDVGLEAGQMDPRDVMNPMLFKACTGDNINTLLNQIYNKSLETSPTLSGFSGAEAIGEHRLDGVEELGAYYSMLSDPTWRKSHPMSGLNVKNLRPMVHKVVTTQPFKWTGVQTSLGNSAPGGNAAASPSTNSTVFGMGGPSGGADGAVAGNPTVFVSNGVTPMPWLETTVHRTADVLVDDPVPSSSSIIKYAAAGDFIINDIPRVYMGCLCLPPSITTKWYLRASVSWRIAFKDFRPSYEIGPLGILNYGEAQIQPSFAANLNYANLYHNEETKNQMSSEYSSFSTNGIDAEMITAQPC